MARNKAEDHLSCLDALERSGVLNALLDRHPELRAEANAIAVELLSEVCVESVAEEVSDLVHGVGLDELNHRAGRHDWGYVEPGEAAWDLLEEAIGDVKNDMERRMKAGMGSAAEKVCQGIVLGLHRVGKTKSDGALGWAPDFPEDMAAHSLSSFLELCPQGQRRKAGERIIEGVEVEVEDWIEMLGHAVDRAASSKGRK